MVRAGLGYLAAADAAQLPAATQAECLRELEQDAAVLTAARAWILASFTAGQGYADDADYSAVSWLIHRTGITSGAAVGHTAWAKRAATHPRVLAALAAGQVSESAATADLPVDRQAPGAVPGRRPTSFSWRPPRRGWGWRSWPGCSGRCTSGPAADLPDEDPDRDFEDRALKLATTFGGAGVMHGDLTPECAEMVGRVLDALSAPAGAEDDADPGSAVPRRAGGGDALIVKMHRDFHHPVRYPNSRHSLTSRRRPCWGVASRLPLGI